MPRNYSLAMVSLLVLVAGSDPIPGAELPATDLRVGAAAVNLAADDSMPMAGIAGRPKSQGQEGELRVVAVVLDKPDSRPLAIVACDVLWVTRDLVDPALAEIERTTGIPAGNVLVNATHTHHAPATTRTHDWVASEDFRKQVQAGIVKAVQNAHGRLEGGESHFYFHLAMEATIGANSRLLLEDGRISWLNPLREAASKGKPTGPFDPELPVLDFRDAQGRTRALIYNHSTHTIGTRSGQNNRSASFYGLAAQDLEAELGGVVNFLEGASGSTHNIAGVPVPEMIERLKTDVRDARQKAQPRTVTRLASLRRPFKFKVRTFDDAEEDAKIVHYAEKYAPQTVEYWQKLFGGMRAEMRTHQGEERETWVQALVIGDVALVGVPAEYFTSLGVDIKQRSPFKQTYVAELANDWIGYLPDRKAHELGGYQTWMGLHSFAEIGTGERIADEVVTMLHELAGQKTSANQPGARATPKPGLEQVARENAPRDPAAEHATFRLADPELVVELVAAEPDLDSPVAVAWDAEGVMYVAEMSDYPGGPPGGRVRRLEDRDGDGRPERVTLFAEKLPLANSVLPWNGGVLVTAAPDIVFLKDTDGDGVADVRRVVLTGFVAGNPQLLVNGLTWGLDNWVYAANGRSDGDIRRPEDPPEKAVSIRRHDVRFRPDTGQLEPVAGHSQFGLATDDWGGRFPSWNTVPLRHVVLEDRPLSRNPHLAASATVAQILDPRDDGRVYPLSAAPRRFNRESVDFFNASCGPGILRGSGLGVGYRGDVFVCEPLTNLVHRCVLQPSGPTFLARRIESEREFLASTDPWFHPVNVANGPDGALYVVDFYREWVEHPQWVPEALRDKVDWRNGARHGRLWRIRRRDQAPEPGPMLTEATPAELVVALAHPNGWMRDTAQRLLVERADSTAVPSLRELVLNGQSPQARVHALWTLHGLAALDDRTLQRSLRDGHPRVREQSVLLCGERLVKDAEWLHSLAELVGDVDPRVRMQVAVALGGSPDTRAVDGLVALTRGDISSPWMRLALLSGLGDNAERFLECLIDRDPDWLLHPKMHQATFLTEVAAIIGSRSQEQELVAALSRISQGDHRGNLTGRLALLAGLGDGLARTKRPLHAWLDQPPAGLAASQAGLASLFSRAVEIVRSPNATDEDRIAAMRPLIHARLAGTGALLVDLLSTAQPEGVQFAAARGLGNLSDIEAAGRGLDKWQTLTVGTRRELLSALLGRAATAELVVVALETEKLGVGDLDPGAREALRHLKGEPLKDRARAFLESNASADRAIVLRAFLEAQAPPADPARGRELFSRNCQTCHQPSATGSRVGPDLSAVASRPVEALLSDILNPNGDVGADFFSYILVTNQGRVLTGLLVTETASGVTLRTADGREETVLRSEIEEFRGSGRTLMPDGLETLLGNQGVWDVIAWLREPRGSSAPRR